MAIQQDIGAEHRAREAAERLERAKSEFLGSVSHELRTPLTSIFGYVALLRQDIGDSDKSAQHLDIIERNANRELGLVDDLLSVARIGSGEFRMEMEPVDLDAVVGAAVEELRPAAAAAGVALEIADGDQVVVEADADRLAQVVTNLVTNAIKFTGHGGAVRIDLTADRDRALLRVIDEGIGVEAHERARIFERLFRGERAVSGQVDGAGLGLSITRSIVEAHGGSVELAQTSGEGSTFGVSLPPAG